ncbi:exopolysaccharide synthesis ExoD [Calothrix sp. NIES-4071]|nr:exopolysaccharide synthesis ExoD [Calothrix sp. NIES-4071]BAZ60271.1 exopolysaccharide synthesis ExoD [Calothrix sp. NIES-4105]
MQTSKLLQNILQRHTEERIYLRDLVSEMGERSFAGLLMICALPEALPLPVAGVSAIIGIPLMIVSAQLLLGFRKPWLPSWIANRSLKRKDVEKLISKILVILKKYESVIRPRWKFVTHRNAQRLLGLLLLILAFIIALPIPFGNMIPAIIIIIISLGLIEQDGVVIALGACLSCVLFAFVAYALLALSQFIPQFNNGAK